MMPDPFLQWLGALEGRHFAALNFQEVRRAVQALSALYVERRNRIADGSAFDGAGKRAAFATYFAPLHFLLVREIIRALDAASVAVSDILDLGCGTGIAGAAWALEMNPQPRITGIDRNSWAAREAKWTYGAFHLRSTVRSEDLATFKIGKSTAVIAAFTINELSDEMRTRMLREMLSASRLGSPVLVIEPIARTVASWWPEWSAASIAAGGRDDEWRFSVPLPNALALMDKAAGLDHRELTGRSLWIPSKKI
jgi:methyltransferase family protein